MTTPFDDSSSQILVSTDAVKRRRNEKRLSRFKVSLFAAMLVVAIVATGSAVFFGSQYASVNSRVSELEAAAASASQQAGDSQSRIEELEASVAEKDQQIASQNELLESRKGFLTALEEASALIAEARPKVSVAGFYSAVSAEQEKVLKERSNPSVVTNATAAVREAMNVLRTAVKDFDDEQARLEEERARQDIDPNDEPPAGGTAPGASTPSSPKSSNSVPTTPEDSALVNVRSALNSVGGGWVRLERADMVCDMETALACAYYEGKVVVKNEYLDKSAEWWTGPMAHEYAHMIQYKNWYALLESQTLTSLFGQGQIEPLADCMATVKVPSWRGPYHPDCTGDQLAYAQRVWNGSVV